MALKHRMHGSELIIGAEGELYHINISRRHGFPPRFLLVGDPGRVREVAKFFDGGVKAERGNREYYSVWGTYKGLPVAAMGTGIGTDNTEIASTETHAVHEYNLEKDEWEKKEPMTLIRVGTSGSPQRDIRLGTLAISRHAIGLDNTGLYYLHRPLESYEHLEDVFYTPDNPVARRIWLELTKALPPAAMQVVRPYVSTAAADVVKALSDAAESLGSEVESGITTSAPGFYGPQGRRVGRLQNIIIPDLQERLARIRVQYAFEVQDDFDFGSMRAVNNEMESSTLFRISEILGYRAGAICLVIANRAEDEFITPEQYATGVDRIIKVALDAMHELG